MEFVLNDREYLYEKVSDTLSSVGISPIRLGYTYLMEAVVYVLEDNEALNGITKTVYPALARNFGTTPQAVERAIRTAISDACSFCNDKMNSFGYKWRGKTHFTNKEFIFEIVKLLEKQSGIVNIDEY